MKLFVITCLKPLCLFAMAGALSEPAAWGQSSNAPPSSEVVPELRYLPPSLVLGERVWLPEVEIEAPTVQKRLQATDTASLLAETPGAAVVRNGPLTGIVQVRGLGGDRVKVAVDGMTITPACPNHMDPPLHYATPMAVDSLTVFAGVTPVSRGGDSIGGTILIEPAAPQFSTNDHPRLAGELSGFYRSSNDGYGFEGQGAIANQRLSADYLGSWQRANDLRFPGGTVRDTGFETMDHGLTTALRTAPGFWSVDAGLTRTRDAGTPALPMDMIEDDSYRIGLKHLGDYDFGSIEGRFFYHTIDHLMDNYSLRPPAAGMPRMFSPAESDDWGFGLGTGLPYDLHTFRIGTDFHINAFDAYQQNAVTGARQDTINDAMRTRVGAYLEWQADWTEQWTTLLGVRNDTVLSDASDVTQNFLPTTPDRNAFNAQDHSITDANFDLTAAARFEPGSQSLFELAFARKNRAPSLLERYLWTPLSASAGQADGRTYLGNLDLASEVSYQFAATADWHGTDWQVKVTPFYNYVTDYIQGNPIARVDTTGRPVLQFQNFGQVDLYGAELTAKYDISPLFTARGSLSYVRGINRDTDDNLYRIAPLHGVIDFEHHWKSWRNTVEVVLVDSQKKVSAYNGEPETPGYALLNLRTSYTLWEHFTISVALENVFDTHYTDHLGGVNRVLGSDVAVGERIPGAGRFVLVAAHYKF